ncbi:MAG: hypothetical protein BAJALOKI2v1_80074 [Promethearchaeota archaeon]|nr:MAG: hypothetical protein BAJALOKI2v1_80074 [Candidatus Lokiarchaeota archaeon]
MRLINICWFEIVIASQLFFMDYKLINQIIRIAKWYKIFT